MFATISDAVFGKKLGVNLVPSRLGIGQNTVEIEDDCLEHGAWSMEEKEKLTS